MKLHLSTRHAHHPSSVSTYIAKDGPHTATLGKPFENNWAHNECCVVIFVYLFLESFCFSLESQCNQHNLMLSARNRLPKLSLQFLLLENVTGFFLLMCFYTFDAFSSFCCCVIIVYAFVSYICTVYTDLDVFSVPM